MLLVLVLAACSGTEDTTTTTTGSTTTTSTRDTTTTTTTATRPPFDGLSLNASSCDYGGKIESITATQEHEVVFELCSPDPAFLAKTSFVVFGIQPVEHLEATFGAPLQNPIGTGPYRLREWDEGESITYARFDDYYGQGAPHATVVLRWGSEADRLAALQDGMVDGISAPVAAGFAAIEDDPATELVTKHEPNVLYAGMTNTFEPFDDPRVRTALALGIDRQRLVDGFYPPGSEIASHFSPCSVRNGCVGAAWYEHDLDAARRLLADAGLEDGFETTIFYRDLPRGYLTEPEALAMELAAQLEEDLNIVANVVPMQRDEFITELRAGRLDGIHLFGWTGQYAHVTDFLDRHFTERNRQFGVQDPDYTEPLAAASLIADPVTAAPLYIDANNAIRDVVPMVPIVHTATALGYAANVEGAYAPPWGDLMFNRLDNGEDTLVFMQANEPRSLYCADETDPDSHRACAQVVESLYSYDPTGRVTPQLAEECVADESLTRWTCTLRRGVIFHDGSMLDANDVVASWSAGLDAASPLHTGNTGSWTYQILLWDRLINADG